MDEGTSGSGEKPKTTVVNTQDVFKAVVTATRCAKALPKLGDNYELYNSYPVFAELMQVEGERILQLISKLCKHAGAKTQLLDNTLLVEERTERLAEVNDYLLEQVGNLLDEAAGLRRPEELVVVGPDTRAPLSRTIGTSWNRALHNRLSIDQRNAENGDDDQSSRGIGAIKGSGDGEATRKRPIRLLASLNVARPQVHFADQIDNSNKPFVSKLRFKHNAKEKTRSDNVRIVDDDDDETEDKAINTDTDMEASAHPYKYELDHFEPESWQLEYPREIKEAPPIEETPLVYIRTEKQLDDLCATLKSVREFAVDLEAHQYRTFQGLTCLMQISTRTHDYIVDTLSLWRQMHKLNDPFTDSSILKVFHGGNLDVVWLQRDFGIHVVNLFDTGQAMRLLMQFPRFSLAHLVKHYCKDEELDKQYQLADWRIRPLPEELIMYARKDTHYLLYCYDRLRRDLLDAGNEQQNLLKSVYSRSRDICLHVYRKKLYKPDDHLALLEKSRKRFNSRQFYALKKLYEWRDHLARTEDESYPYVLPDHMMLQIAEVLPREMQGIWACCSPVPALVRQDSHTLHRIILHARALPLENEGRLLQTEKEAGQEIKYGLGLDAAPLNEIRNRIFKSHDFSHSAADEEIVPLTQRLSSISGSVEVKEKPSLTFFVDNLDSENGEQQEQKKKKKRNKLVEETKKQWYEMLTPYDRYLLALESAAAAAEAEMKASAKDGGVENETRKSKKRKMYSHLDRPIVGDQKTAGSNLMDESEMPSTSAEAGDKDEIGAVAKKKRKVMTAVEVEEEEEPTEAASTKSSRKRKRKSKTDLNLALAESYDYAAAADKAMFSKGVSSQQQTDVFEPHKAFLKKRDKKAKHKSNVMKGMTGTISGGDLKKKSAKAFSSFESPSGSGKGKGKKGKF